MHFIRLIDVKCAGCGQPLQLDLPEGTAPLLGILYYQYVPWYCLNCWRKPKDLQKNSPAA